MFVIFGSKDFSHKCVGYASDFCESCKRPAMIEKWRSFRWVHLFMVPLVPIGYRKRWSCCMCGQDPNGEKTSRIGNVGAALIVGLFAWFMYWGGAEDGLSVSYVIFLTFLGAVSVSFLVSAIFHKSGPTEERQNATIPPVDTNNCAYCGGSLVKEPRLRCESCELDVFGGGADA